MAATPPALNVGNQIDAVAKKKVPLDLPIWVYAVAIVAANLVGVLLHV